MAVEGFKSMAHGAEVQQPDKTAQKLIGGDVILNPEAVEQRFLILLSPHHRLILQPA
jgi:hypothetical protein